MAMFWALAEEPAKAIAIAPTNANFLILLAFVSDMDTISLVRIKTSPS
jgi:hypothetical protein